MKQMNNLLVKEFKAIIRMLNELMSYHMPEVRGGGREEQPHFQGAAAAWAQEGREELLHIQGQEGCREGIPLVQGKEQRLRFAGAIVKRYPTSQVRETQVRR